MKVKFSFVIAVFSLLSLFSCDGYLGSGNASLETTDDSVSYGVGVLITQNLPLVASERFAISPEHYDDFVRGVRDAFPLENSPEALAYVYGLYIGSSSLGTMQHANSMAYPDDTINRINPRLFLEATVSHFSSDTRLMERETAIAFYNEYRYRSDNDRFMQQNLTRPGVKVTPEGLQYKIAVEGSGPVAAPGDSVMCMYKGSFTNGETFESSRGHVLKLSVKDLIPGLSQALQILPEGTQAKVYIPWQLAYGASGTEGVPPYSTLVFDVDIRKVIRK